MKITWIGQAGLLLEIKNKVIIIDPYLSDSVERINPLNFRRVKVEKSFLEYKPDYIILTHDHLDHTDPETLKYYLTDNSGVCVLASKNAWDTVRKFGGNNNYVMFNRYTEWSADDIVFKAVYAEHSDESAIGVIIKFDDKKLYITGDTLYNSEIFCDLPNGIDIVFLPINGVGNNMNMHDGMRFCKKINPKFAVPMHCGLFDEIDMNKFQFENKIVQEIYKEIEVKL